MRVIAHISDLHFGRHDTSVAGALIEQIAELSPDLVILSGDLTQRARSEEFVQARHFIDHIRQPVLIVPGNHDIPLYNPVHRFLRPFEKFRRHVSEAAVADDWYCDGELAVLGLNTARSLTWKSGRVSIEQMGLVRRAFVHAPDDAWRIVVTHHPIASPHGEARVDLAGRSMLALRTITGAGVHVLLSGHHHRPVSGHIDAELVMNNTVLVVHAGTAVSTRTRHGHGNSYNVIRLDGPHAAIEVRLWDESLGFQPARTSNYWFGARAGMLEPEPG